jgi:hypothetical protein
MEDLKVKSVKIGLFWLTGGTVLAAVKQRISDGVQFADGYIRSDLYHIDVWRDLHRYGMLDNSHSSRPVPFYLLPHGSVGYNITAKVPVIFHGNWYQREMKQPICEAFDLPYLSTITVKDEWFDCSEMSV